MLPDIWNGGQLMRQLFLQHKESETWKKENGHDENGCVSFSVLRFNQQEAFCVFWGLSFARRC